MRSRPSRSGLEGKDVVEAGGHQPLMPRRRCRHEADPISRSEARCHDRPSDETQVTRSRPKRIGQPKQRVTSQAALTTERDEPFPIERRSLMTRPGRSTVAGAQVTASAEVQIAPAVVALPTPVAPNASHPTIARGDPEYCRCPSGQAAVDTRPVELGVTSKPVLVVPQVASVDQHSRWTAAGRAHRRRSLRCASGVRSTQSDSPSTTATTRRASSVELWAVVGTGTTCREITMKPVPKLRMLVNAARSRATQRQPPSRYDHQETARAGAICPQRRACCQRPESRRRPPRRPSSGWCRHGANGAGSVAPRRGPPNDPRSARRTARERAKRPTAAELTPGDLRRGDIGPGAQRIPKIARATATDAAADANPMKRVRRAIPGGCGAEATVRAAAARSRVGAVAAMLVRGWREVRRRTASSSLAFKCALEIATGREQARLHGPGGDAKCFCDRADGAALRGGGGRGLRARRPTAQ